MIPEGHILLHRKLMESSVWTCKPSVRVVFITCLFKANWREGKWFNRDLGAEETIPRGAFVTSREHLALDAGVSVQELRTALGTLESLQILTRKSTHNSTHITVLKYDTYQNPTTRRATDDQPTSNQRATTIEEVKEVKEVTPTPLRPAGAARFQKPSAEDVTAYGKTIGFPIDGSQFCDYYESNGWRVGKAPMKDWRATVRNWKRNGYATVKPPAAPRPTYHETVPDEKDLPTPADLKKLLEPLRRKTL